MNDNLSTIKDMAGEFALEAELAEKRGDLKTARLFYQKAYAITKEHFLKVSSAKRYQLTRSIYGYHAAYYALLGGLFEEAARIAQDLLSEKPHIAITLDLKTIFKKAKQAAKSQNNTVATIITGTLIGADLPSCTLKVLGQKDNQYYGIQTTKEQIVRLNARVYC